MNHIKRLQRTVRQQDGMIEAARDGLALIIDYCQYAKFQGLGNHWMNPDDVVLRANVVLGRIADAEYVGTLCSLCRMQAAKPDHTRCQDCIDDREYGEAVKAWEALNGGAA